MRKELWVQAKGFEGFYEVSSLGNIRSISRYINHEKGGKRWWVGKILSIRQNRKYIRVILSKKGKKTTIDLHRLVAMSFLPNPNQLPCVNHKDENTKNNVIENLEWCTHKYNTNYKNMNVRRREKFRKEIAVIRPTGEEEFFPSITDACCKYNLSKSSVSRCLNGKQSISKGFRFRYLQGQEKENATNKR